MTRTRYLSLGMATTTLVALIDVAIFAVWSFWHFHGVAVLRDDSRLFELLLPNIGFALLLALPSVVVATSVGLLTALVVRQWRYGDRYVLAAPCAILPALILARMEYGLFHQHQPVAVIVAALSGAVTGPIPVLLLVWARRRFGTREDPPAPVSTAHPPKRSSLVAYALIWMVFATQAGILFLVALAALMAFVWGPQTLFGSGDMVGPLYVMLAIPATPTAGVCGAILGWLIAMTPLGRTERRARVVSAFTATFIPTSVLVLYGVLVAIGGAFETGHALTVSSVLSTLLTLVGSELGVLYGIAVLVTILGGSYVGFDLYNRLHATPDEGEPVTVAL